MIKFRLSEKGILVVSLTLIFQLGFVLALTMMLRNAHEQVQREREAREVISQLNRLSGLADNASIGLSQQMVSPDPPDSPEFYKSYKQFLEAIPKQMSLLVQLTKNGTRSKEMQELSTTILEGVEAVDKFRLAHLDRKPQRDYLALALQDISLTKTRQVNGLLESFERDQESDTLAEASSYEMVLRFLGYGVLANFFIAILLMVVFTKGIAKKVDRVRDNAERLSVGVPLLPPLHEADELGVLDASFHNMARGLAEAIRREQALTTNAVDVIFSLDEKGKCVDINPASKAVLGFVQEELLGRHFIGIVIEEDKEKTLEFLRDAKQLEHPVQFENQMLTGRGEVIDVGWSVHWSQGDKAYFCVVHDVSHRKQIERLKRDFVAMVSHDLRAPLSSVQLILQSTVDETYGSLPTLAADRLNMAQTSVGRLIGLVNGLMSIEKLESGEVELAISGLRAKEVIVPAVHLVQGLAASRDLEIVVPENTAVNANETPAANTYFYGDKEQLIQVIANLLSNAIKFSPAGEKVIVSVSKSPEFVRFQVQDAGRGVPKEMQTMIFERFKQVQRTDDTEMGGTGLGLSICRSIVERHGGTIGVVSEEGKGSTFWFQIPMPADDGDFDE